MISNAVSVKVLVVILEKNVPVLDHLVKQLQI
jgi:hypothetical protein